MSPHFTDDKVGSELNFLPHNGQSQMGLCFQILGTVFFLFHPASSPLAFFSLSCMP
jgi:hypothetical protein